MRYRFKEMRKALHLSQKKFADSVGISMSYVNFIEMGYNTPSDKIVDKICCTHGISKRWLTTGYGNMFDKDDEENNSVPKPYEVNDPKRSVVCKNESISNVNIRKRLKILRKKLGLSQAEMASKLGIQIYYVSWIETGKKQLKEGEIANICDIFNVRIDWLIEGTGKMFEGGGPTIPLNDDGAIEAGEKLKELREGVGLTQKEFAKQAGLNRWHIVLAEQGTRLLNDEQIKRICDTFDIKEETLKFSKRNLVKKISRIGKKDEVFNTNYELIPMDLRNKLRGEELANLVDLLYQRYEDGKSFVAQKNQDPAPSAPYVGQKFGKLTITEFCPRKPRELQRVIAKCDCGTVKEYRLDSLISGNTKSCGCSKRLDLTGKRFGKLTVIAYAGLDEEQKCSMWKCRCDCGKITTVRGGSLTYGTTKSCGCEFSKFTPNAITDQVDGTRINSLLYTKHNNNTSGHVGVSFNKRRQKWEAYIQFKGYLYHLGLYEDIQDAIKARERAEKEKHGAFMEWFQKTHPEEWERVLKTKKDNIQSSGIPAKNSEEEL